MINELYTAKKGTPHVVRVVNVVREMTKGEKMENTAKTQQVLLQRQKFYTFGKETLHEDDLNFEEFSMELELFLEEYEKKAVKCWGGTISIIGATGKINTTKIKHILSDEVPDKQMKTNIKMRVTPEQSVKVQEICIKNGIGWAEKSKSNGKYAIQYTDKPYLYISQAITWGVNQANYEQTEYVEVDPELFILTNGTCAEGQLCSTEELKIIKDALEEIEPSSAYDFNDFEFVEEDPISPSHYKIGGIETIDYIAAKLTPEEFKGYCKGNTIKYLSRAGHKGREVEDYKKAAWYLDKLIGVLNESH